METYEQWRDRVYREMRFAYERCTSRDDRDRALKALCEFVEAYGSPKFGPNWPQLTR